MEGRDGEPTARRDCCAENLRGAGEFPVAVGLPSFHCPEGDVHLWAEPLGVWAIGSSTRGILPCRNFSSTGH